MRHFASQSGKSKGQFYTPSEVSRILAKVIGINPSNSVASTTAYDPTCGSGSLLLKVAAEAGKHITLEGQEMDVTTAGLARMNMILHDFPTANVLSGNTLSSPKFTDGEQLRAYDYVVANPPFSVKTWTIGLTPESDPYQRFAWGVPPAKQGDYAFLLHIIRSLKSTGKGACILPHGVLFRGNAEAAIRQQLVRSGYLKAIIGLPANLFYGTGIPACILVLDKENATARKGILMIDASKGFKKDGPKNRLREQDLHRIVDTFSRQSDVPGYARLVPVSEIADPKNDYNLNLPRYIDSSDKEDLQDIDAHLNGGIPVADIDAMGGYWAQMPGLRASLYSTLRPGYAKLNVPINDVKSTILAHAEFKAFTTAAFTNFASWKVSVLPRLRGMDIGGHPKELIGTIAEELLESFKGIPLLDTYDVYQHLMDYWAESMQDDCYVISDVGWKAGAAPREIVQVKDKNNKLVWPEKEDFLQGRRRYKSDLIPVSFLIARYLTAESDAIAALEADIANIDQQLTEAIEEHGGEDGLLTEVIEGEGDKQKITVKNLKGRLKDIGRDPEYADERKALESYNKLLDDQAVIKARLKTASENLEAKVAARYASLSVDDIKAVVVDDKWIATLSNAIEGEVDRISQTLTTRVRELADRYSQPLPVLVHDVESLSAKVDEHLKRMGVQWN
jgi:type I restriction enzyme M protein